MNLEHGTLNFERVLTLTGRTVTRAAISQRDAFNFSRADPAGFAAPIINAEMVLKLAELVVGVAVIRKRSSAPANRLPQHGTNHACSLRDFSAGQALRPRRRPYANTAENFVRVDIPDTRDYLLIQEQVTNPAGGFPRERIKVIGSEAVIEWIEPQMLKLC